MAGKEVYIIRVEGKTVEVTPEIYYTYFHMERQERGQEEKMRRNAVLTELLPGLQNRPVRTLFFRYKYIQLPLAIQQKVW